MNNDNLQKIALEVIDLLSEKCISINEASFVLEQADTIMKNETKVKRANY